MDIYSKIALKIIAGQEAIIGPVAIEQAKLISHLELDYPTSAAIKGNKTEVLEDLIQRYEDLFGQISVEVSKRSAAGLLSELPSRDLPASLR